LAPATPAWAQKKQSQEKNSRSNRSSSDAKAMPPMNDTQAVDLAIGQSLGYWQIGDVESLHKYYADDVSW